jgi:hypothetical protein
MEASETNVKAFDERQSLETIKAAIATSKRNFLDDGILLVIWGLGLSLSNFWNFYKSAKLTAWWFRNLMDILQIVIGIGIIGLTLYFIFFRRKKVTSFATISTRLVWIGVIVAHNIIVIITKTILNEINFFLLQPLQMVLIGFALFVSAGIYRYYILLFSGIIMWGAAILAANFDLNTQFLVRSLTEFICFVIPGYLMIRAKKTH